MATGQQVFKLTFAPLFVPFLLICALFGFINKLINLKPALIMVHAVAGCRLMF